MVALVIHDHAGTHVPVQYIQALLVQLEHTCTRDEDARPVNFTGQTASSDIRLMAG